MAVISGLFGLGALVALLHILMAAGYGWKKGEVLDGETRFAFLMVGGTDALVALLGFLLMYGTFTLRRWARYGLLVSGLLGLTLAILNPQVFLDLRSLDIPAGIRLAIFVVLPATLVVFCLTPAVRQTMSR
jgi:hypothetical protein